jgi:hypothetical protein
MSRRHVDRISENEIMKTEQTRPVYCEPARPQLATESSHCIYVFTCHMLPSSIFCLSSFLSLSLSLFPFSFLSVSYFLLYILHSSFLSLLFLVRLISCFLSLYNSMFPSFFPYFYFHLSFCLPLSHSCLVYFFITFCLSLLFSLPSCVPFFRRQIAQIKF